MSQQSDPDAWARFRFSVIGHLLAAPPPRGELHRAITELLRIPAKLNTDSGGR